MALWWLAGYVAATGALLLRRSVIGLTGLHVVLIVVAGALARTDDESPGLARTAGDLLLLVAAPLLYFEIPALIAAAGNSYHDAAIQRLEVVLFGGQLSQTLATLAPWSALSEVLHAGYLAYYPMIFLPPVLLLRRGDRAGFARTMLVLTVTFTVCWAIYTIFPVQGPRYLWSVRPDVPDGPLRRLTFGLAAAGSSQGTAFPSSHMAVMVAQAVAAWAFQRRVSYVAWVIAALIGIGAVYGGFHYGTDIVAGGVLGFALAALVLRASRPRS